MPTSARTSHLWLLIQGWMDAQFIRVNQAQLADAIGVTRQTVSQWKHRQVIPTPDNLQRISEAGLQGGRRAENAGAVVLPGPLAAGPGTAQPRDQVAAAEHLRTTKRDPRRPGYGSAGVLSWQGRGWISGGRCSATDRGGRARPQQRTRTR